MMRRTLLLVGCTSELDALLVSEQAKEAHGAILACGRQLRAIGAACETPYWSSGAIDHLLLIHTCTHTYKALSLSLSLWTEQRARTLMIP